MHANIEQVVKTNEEILEQYVKNRAGRLLITEQQYTHSASPFLSTQEFHLCIGGSHSEPPFKEHEKFTK